MDLKRIMTDLSGYGLLLLALLTGWLPGPGGIPLALAGLALLSIHNAWARRVREYAIANGATIGRLLFIDHPLVQAGYDTTVLVLLIVGAVLAWQHGAIWQLGLATFLLCLALGIGLANRNRYKRFARLLKHKR